MSVGRWCDEDKWGMATVYLDKPDSAMTGFEHDVFVGVWMRVVIIWGSQ